MIFIVELKNEIDRNLAVRYICLMLPKHNLDILSAISKLMKHVSSLSTANKMNMQNLSTVMAPNILYFKNPGVAATNMSLTIKAVFSM